MKENYSAVNMMILQEKGYFGHDDAALILDGDPHFIINAISREIVNNSKKTDLIQFDHNSERITFECPHFIEGHDMTFCNKVAIDYSVGESKGVYEVNDLAVKEDDSDTVVFTWLISSNVTTTLGKIKFALTFKCVLPDGTVTYKWSTKRNDTLQCLDTEQGNAWVAYDYPDILEQWKTKIFDARDNSVKDIVSSTNNGVSKIASEGKSQVQSINTAGITVKNDIEKKASDTLATIPENYTQLDSDVSVLKSENVRYSARFGNALLKKTTGDKSVTMTDSADAVFHDLKISGKSEQMVTTGAQLLPQPQFNDTKNGITVKTQIDGGISITGTATAAITFTVAEILILAGDYTLSGLSGLVVGRMYFQLVEISAQGGQFVGELAKVGHVASTTITIDRDVWARAEIKVLSGVTADSVCYPMLNVGTTALPWEPYTGGVPSPSPDYPQDIISVGTVSKGKQLLNADTIVQGMVNADTGKLSSSSIAVSSDYIEVRPGNYFLSGEGLKPYMNRVVFYDVEKAYISSDSVYAKNGLIIVPETAAYMRLRFVSTENLIPADIKALNPMLNAGDTALPWEPYTGGKPSPSVEYPQTLEVGVTGKNLFDTDNYVEFMVSNHNVTSNIINKKMFEGRECLYINGRVNSPETVLLSCLPELTYTISYDVFLIQVNGSITGNGFGFRRPDNTIRYVLPNNTYIGKWQTLTTTITGPGYIFPTYGGGSEQYINLESIQVEVSEKATSWEPYRSASALITLTEPLRGVGDYLDRIRCRDGVWGIERRIKRIVFEGNIIKKVYAYANNGIPAGLNYIGDNDLLIGSNLYCIVSHYAALKSGNTWSYPSNDKIAYVSNNTSNSAVGGRLYIRDNRFTTSEEMQSHLESCVLSGNPVIAYAVMAGTTWEPLPDATQQALNALTTYAGTTHLTITAGGPAAGIEAEYVQDINGVIADLLRQIEALRNAHTN